MIFWSRLCVFGLTLLAAAPCLLNAAPVTIDLPPHSFTYSGWVRGYWFTAPASFTITGLFVPFDASSGDQTIEVLRFNSQPPPVYPGATNDFVSLFRVVNDPGATFIPVNIPVAAGQIIGILGYRGQINSYGQGDYSTSIGGYPVVLTRMGMQDYLTVNPAHDIWQEPGYYISRVFFQYDNVAGSAIPEPGTFGLVLAGGILALVRYRRR